MTEIIQMNITTLRAPTGGEADLCWLFTRVAEELTRGLTENNSSQCLGRYLNLQPLDFKSRALTTRPRCHAASLSWIRFILVLYVSRITLLANDPAAAFVISIGLFARRRYSPLIMLFQWTVTYSSRSGRVCSWKKPHGMPNLMHDVTVFTGDGAIWGSYWNFLSAANASYSRRTSEKESAKAKDWLHGNKPWPWNLRHLGCS